MASAIDGIVLPRNGILEDKSAQAKLALPVIVYLITVMTPAFTQVGPLYLSLLRFFLLIVILPMLGRLVAGHFGKLHLVDYMFFAHIAWATLGMAINNPDQVIENSGSAAVEFLGGYIIGRAYIRDKWSMVKLIKLLAMLTVFTLPFAFMESQNGEPIIVNLINKIPLFRSVADIEIERRMGLSRAQVVFAHPIHYGLFASASFAMVWIGLRSTISATSRMLICAAIGFCVFLSLSSGALLALVMQIFLISWATVLSGMEKRWKLLLALVVAFYILIDLFSNRSPLEVFMSYATFSAHNAYWRSIIFEWGVMNILGSAEQGIPSAKLFGIGLSDWVRPTFMHSGSMDNFWLVNAVRYGIPGLLFLAIGYGSVLWHVSQRDMGNDRVLQNLRLAWMISFVGLTFTLATVHIWTTLYSFVFFMFSTGVWLMTAEPEDGSSGTAEREGGGKVLPSRTAYTRFPNGVPASASARQPTSTGQSHASRSYRLPTINGPSRDLMR